MADQTSYIVFYDGYGGDLEVDTILARHAMEAAQKVHKAAVSYGRGDATYYVAKSEDVLAIQAKKSEDFTFTTEPAPKAAIPTPRKKTPTRTRTRTTRAQSRGKYPRSK